MGTIERNISARIVERIKPGRAVLIFGARRVGKTVLLRQIFDAWVGKKLLLNGEDSTVGELLSNRSVANYRNLFGSYSLLAIDEAQTIPEVGKVLKLIVDEVPGLAVIATGSSSFDLKQQAGEPLVGRATQFMLLPMSQIEISQIENPFETRSALETRLIYGSYPDVVLMDTYGERADYLSDMVTSYLLKDILAVDGVRDSEKMRRLLKLIALQIGSEVSVDELARTLGMSKNTIERYLDLLSKVFVIFRMGSYSRNMRNEVAKGGKWYFYDVGLRNAIVGNFSPIASRTDIGALWENYLISERIKWSNNSGAKCNYYFWRTYAQKEIDLIEEHLDGSIGAYEFKWGDKHPKAPLAFTKSYPEASFTVVSRDNYLDGFICGGSDE